MGTFPEAVARVSKAKNVDPSKWLKDSLKMGLPQMRKAAAELGAGEVFFDWDAARLWRVTIASRARPTSASRGRLLSRRMRMQFGWRPASRFSARPQGLPRRCARLGPIRC